MWLFPGDTLTSAELSITSSENGGTSYFDQTVNFTRALALSNQFGFNVCTESTTFSGPTLNAGTYWLNLQNASEPERRPGLLGRELRSVIGFGELLWFDSFGVIHGSGHYS